MSDGNWGFTFIDHIRSRRSWRTRIVLTVVSILAGVLLLALWVQFGKATSSELPGEVIVIVGLLGLGVVFGLRPWARK